MWLGRKFKTYKKRFFSIIWFAVNLKPQKGDIKMYKSVITIAFKSDWDNDGIEERVRRWDTIEEMLIPKVLGSALGGFLKAFRSSKLLGIGHRKRGDVGMWQVD